MFRFMLILITLTLGALTCVWSNLQLRGLQYEMTEVKKELRQERRSYKQVRIEFEQLRSPSRLQKLMEEGKGKYVSQSKARAQQLTPQQMRRVIRRKRLADGRSGHVQTAYEEER